jgi:hypothetical protein
MGDTMKLVVWPLPSILKLLKTLGRHVVIDPSNPDPFVRNGYHIMDSQIPLFFRLLLLL